jgi:hypothetical protein
MITLSVSFIGVTPMFLQLRSRSTLLFGTLVLGLSIVVPEVRAEFFNTAHFVPHTEYAVGIEPEAILSSPSSVGVSGRYTYGIGEGSNLSAIVGTGGGNRQFRVGGNMTLDIFPDKDSQPGVGVAFQGLYVQMQNAGSVEVSGIPYIHKALNLEMGVVEPFLAVPFGVTLSQGVYQTWSQIILGGIFQHSDHLRSVAEIGINMSNSFTYISGGLVYYH